MRTDGAALSIEARRATVAIVMANYNHARYLHESLGGIRNQTRRADEIILVDDASTDRSAEIIRQFARDEPRVRFLQNDGRLGVQGAIARALPLVAADYLVWTAADDRLLPDFLERSMAALERHPQAGLCFSETSELRDGTGEIVRFAKDPFVSRTFALGDLPEYLSPDDVVRRMERGYLPIAANTVVVKRDALLALRGYPHQLEWYADSFAYTVVALRRGACVVADTLAVIRATPGSYSRGMQEPSRQREVLMKMLDLLASPDYRDVRRIFKACPSNFSPAGALMLKVQAQRARDWDLLVPYFWWKVREYKRGHRLTWPQVFFHLLRRVISGPEVNALRRQLEALRAQSAALEASRDGLANTLESERRDHLSANHLIDEYRKILKAAGVSMAMDAPRVAGAESSAAFEEGLSGMFAEIQRADPIYAPSRFWEHHNALNARQLAEQGLVNFKLTANQNYHNFTPTSLFDAKIRRLIRLWRASPTLKPLLFFQEAGYARPSGSERVVTHESFLGFTRERMTTYRAFVALAWEYTRRVDKLGVLKRLEEPELGNPIRIRGAGKLVSQDLATSAREFNAIMEQIAPARNEGDKLVLGELGAGYGRLAYVFLAMTPCRYVIIDIPPALAIAQWYLSTLFAHKKVFRFRPFDTFGEIENELAGSDVAFFTPNQLARFPDRYFDAMISISSLHEMRFDQIAHYLGLIARLAKRHVYLKQYRRYRNPHDRIVVERDVYRLPGAWQTIIDRQDPVYGDFFELMLRRTETR
jgi:putative sugar O-methyltransferase